MNEKTDLITSPLSSQEVDHLAAIEALFFAYRDFVGDADRLLSEFGFGRAHHRALYFVNRRPGLSVAELLDILQITKQSLARVLKQLIGSGYIIQAAGTNDRRQRMLYPTASGRELVLALSAPQSERIKRALDHLDEPAKAAIVGFLNAMRNPQD